MHGRSFRWSGQGKHHEWWEKSELPAIKLLKQHNGRLSGKTQFSASVYFYSGDERSVNQASQKANIEVVVRLTRDVDWMDG